jgi:two-component system, cell cycle sensor histidine kinase and response regulator CckA
MLRQDPVVAAPPIRGLMVDDDCHDFYVTREMLRRAQHGRYTLEWTDSFETGRDAMARQTYDVFLVDYNLGLRTGLELLVEALALGCRRPIILVTGSCLERLDEAARRAGAADFLNKDALSRALLERTIRVAVERAATM